MALDRKLGAGVWRKEVNARLKVLDFVLINRRSLSDKDDR